MREVGVAAVSAPRVDAVSLVVGMGLAQSLQPLQRRYAQQFCALVGVGPRASGVERGALAYLLVQEHQETHPALWLTRQGARDRHLLVKAKTTLQQSERLR